ncbi:glycosyl hydrolases family 31-domain-containing protein [Mycena albidolilacea]|uniref:Glycosyl hydrolases family 31-domain-containing protein n=1 Tax=Mycena albidolilacea TaxID=1033008 RepID=A0AAD6Z5E0_9AGAR|nr:glycosyl hydrolases family 31-domain-containing protein [Mycena albidolilacea]
MRYLPVAAGVLLILTVRPVNSFNVLNCPGYSLHSLLETEHGLTASLNLTGPACNAFGTDITHLTIEVTYETQTRLHVNIFDTANSQFTIPETVITKPKVSSADTTLNSDLVFNYEANPFAFWIPRRSAPHTTPLFDTRLAAALPLGANVYGLGEVIASSGIRRDVGTEGGVGTIQTNWARDIEDPIDQNIYPALSDPVQIRIHPIYMEHRLNTTGTSQSHGVFLFKYILSTHVHAYLMVFSSANGADILLLTPPNANVSVIEYRLLGGTLDLYFLSGPTPLSVMEQYGEIIGTPTWQPYWGFGFHLWGYTSINAMKEVVAKMRAADIPFEVMWNDIDFIPIVDAAIGKTTNSTDIYEPYSQGANLDVFIKNPDGTEYIGQVWPGYTVFLDCFAPNTLGRAADVEFSGIWLDMNEASSFCDGSCGTGIDISNTSMPFLLPGDPGNPITDYPEGYDATISGPSGNITVNGTLTYEATSSVVSTLSRQRIGTGGQTDVDLNTPPYAFHNGFGRLSNHTLATNATHAGGYRELDATITHKALKAIIPGQRPFTISRSAFASSGRWTGHWLGDNYSQWSYLRLSIQGILQHQMFQFPFVGTDACGFKSNTDEELCNRWMQLAAFTPFYRNHNQRGAIPQEPFVWDGVANASRTAIAVRYALLPYWYSLFANASLHGTPPVRALFWEFPNEPELFAVDRDVDGVFPGRGNTIWCDWYTHEVVKTVSGNGSNTTLAAPLGHINVHVCHGAVLLLHQSPAYTVEETHQCPFSLLVTQSLDGHAFGTTYLDDGVSDPPGPSRIVTVHSGRNSLNISTAGAFQISQKLAEVTILGVLQQPIG